MSFTKAIKEKSFLRLAVQGPAKSGKSYTSLRIANGIKEMIGDCKIAAIDTENGSLSKYGDEFDFDVNTLENKDINEYINGIFEASKLGYQILIIDSLSHCWFELLDENEKIAQAKYRGNTWAAWSDTRPKYRKLIQAILDYHGHIICTMRTKTEWIVNTEGGKIRPQKIGTKPEQDSGIDYEFDMIIDIDKDHNGIISGVREGAYGKLDGRVIEKPGEDFGKEMFTVLNTGVDREERERKELEDRIKNGEDKLKKRHKKLNNKTLTELHEYLVDLIKEYKEKDKENENEKEKINTPEYIKPWKDAEELREGVV